MPVSTAYGLDPPIAEGRVGDEAVDGDPAVGVTGGADPVTIDEPSEGSRARVASPRTELSTKLMSSG